MPDQSFTPTSLLVLAIWTILTIIATSVLISRVFRLEDGSSIGPWRRLLLAATTLAIIMVLAS